MTNLAHPYALENRMVDAMARAATTEDLLEVVAGPDAAREFATRGRLWAILDDLGSVDLELSTLGRLTAFRDYAERVIM